MRLQRLPELYTVARLTADTPTPSWVGDAGGSLVSVTRTPDELSVLCPASAVPADVRQESGFRCFRVEGPLAFDLVGILAKLTHALARESISVFAVSTFDTDYMLVKDVAADRAAIAWRADGHEVC